MASLDSRFRGNDGGSGRVSRCSRIPNYIDATQMTTGLLEFSDEKCTRCLACTKICPARSIRIRKEGTTKLDSRLRGNDGGREAKGPAKELPYVEAVAPGVTLCVACGCCLAACPNQAISITRGFNAGFYFRRLSQAAEMTLPRRY